MQDRVPQVSTFFCWRWLAVKLLYYASYKSSDIYLIFLSFAEYVSNLECFQNANEDRKDRTQVSLDGDLLRMGYRSELIYELSNDHESCQTVTDDDSACKEHARNTVSRSESDVA